MLQEVDDGKNLFALSSILITGIGGLSLKFGGSIENPVITVLSIATALIIGIIINVIFNKKGR